MLECPACHRLFPEVGGAPSQVCPHCQHETTVEGDAPAGGAVPARARLEGLTADPVGALQLAVRLAPREYPRLLLLGVPALLVSLAVAYAVGAYEESLGLPLDTSSWSTSDAMRFLGVALPLNLLSSAVGLATWTFVAARVMDAADGGARLWRWKELLGPSLVLGAMLTLVFVAGTLLLLVGLFVFLHWFMFAPARLADGARGAGDALDGSRRYARERQAYGFTGLVVLVGAVALLPAFVPIAGAWGPVATHTLRWLLAPLVPLLVASFIVVAATPRASPTSEPQSARTGATRCPDCGARIEYTPTGSAVEVVCPSCGRTGRVL